MRIASHAWLFRPLLFSLSGGRILPSFCRPLQQRSWGARRSINNRIQAVSTGEIFSINGDTGVVSVKGLETARVMDHVSFPGHSLTGVVLSLHQDHVQVALFGGFLDHKSFARALSKRRGLVKGNPVHLIHRGDDSGAQVRVHVSNVQGRVWSVPDMVRFRQGEFTTPLTTGSSHKHEQNLSSTSGVVADGMRPGKAKTENLDENPHALVPALHTGLNALDMLLRPKLGDRILLAGELLALQDVTTDVICNQARYWDPPEWSTEPFPPVRCIYVSLGETDISPLQARIAALEEHGGMGYTTFIACLAHEPPIHRYLAPFIASTIASHWRSLGEHCLVVVDDMNAHAEAFVELERDVLEGSQHRGIADELHSVFAQLMDRPSRPLGPDVGSVTWFCMSELDMSKIWVRRRDQDHSLELQKRRGATGNRTQVKYGLGLQRQVFRAVNSIADDSMFFDSTASARFPDQAMQALGIPDRRAKRKGPAPPSSTFATHYDNYPPFLPFIELIGSSKKPEDDEKAATFPRAFRHTMDSIKYEILNCREHIARLLEINQRKDLKKYMERIGVDAGRITKRRDHRKRDRYVNMQHLELLLTRDIPVISKSNVTATHSVHRGQILCRVLHQTPRNPLSVLEQVVVVHACTKGYLDTFPPIDLVIDCVLDGILDTLRANNQSSKDLVSRTQQWLDWTPDERDPAAGNDKVFLETILPEIMERASKPIRARISSLETDI